MKRRILNKRTLVYLISILGLMTYFLISISIINRGLDFNYVIFVILLIVTLAVVLKKKDQMKVFYKKHSQAMRIIMIILCMVGFGARFLFLPLQGDFAIKSVLSDTGVHWYGAQQIINNGGVDQEVGEYENIYPYLSAYTGSLAVSMSIFGANYSAVLFLNIFFDLISCLCLYLLFVFWKKDRDIALFASTIWAINPLQIVFCSMPLAIVVVNTLVVLSILCVFLVLRYRNNWIKLCVFSGAVGVIIAIGNAYRPIFLVFLLAFLVYWLMSVISNRKDWKVAGVSCFIAIITYCVVGLVPGILYSQINSYYHGEKSQAGWSFYVGANYVTNGKWSSEDRDVFFGPVLVEEASGDIEKANSIILREGLKRYFDIFTGGHIINHFLNKIGVVFGDVKNATHDLPYNFNFAKDNEIYRLVQDYMLLFYYFVLITVGYFIYKKIKVKEWLYSNTFILFLVILFVGLFCASLLVEVMNRYSLPFIAILVVIALGLMFEKRDRNKKVVL